VPDARWLDAGTGGGSGARMADTNTAETTNVTASTAMAKGAVNNCTSQPATPNPPTSAVACVAASLLLASSSRSRPTTAGMYDCSATSKKTVSKLTSTATR